MTDINPKTIAEKYLAGAEKNNDPRLADRAKMIHDTYEAYDPRFDERCRAAGATVKTRLDILRAAGEYDGSDAENPGRIMKESVQEIMLAMERI